MIDHRLLHRVQPAVVRLQRLDREQRLAVECRQELDAGINRPITQALVIELGNHHGTGAAVALGAAFLAARTQEILAQKLQDAAGRIDVVDLDDFTVEQEAQRIHQLPR